MANILLIEDETVIRQPLCRLFNRNGYTVQEAESVEEALSANDLDEFDLIITDLRLPGEPGTSIIKIFAPKPTLVMTSYASLKSAVESMKLGAADYIAKPFDHDEMLKLVRKILREYGTQSAKLMNADKTINNACYGIIGECGAMRELYRRIAKVAPTDSTVLIIGESGTGKELVAKAIHEHSPRSSGPLISVNCAAIPDTLIEAELFGHEKGAFTGAIAVRKGLVEAADGGILFLDEIGELPLQAQARLLRLLQEKEVRKVGSTQSMQVDVRVIAATHRNLRKLAACGDFREDLFYRLHVLELKIPPLCEREGDVIALVDHFLIRYCKKLGKPTLKLSAQTLNLINQYPWPGNVRELEHAIERAVVLTDQETIEPEHLCLDETLLQQHQQRQELSKFFSGTLDTLEADDPVEDLSLEDYFQRFVLENQEQMNETELAQKLGISRKTLWERRQKLGIPRKKTSGK